MAGPRMTLPTQLVLRVLLEDPDQERYGLEICAAAGLPSGTIHPLLARLERVGWLRSRWEQVDPAHEGRPRRRYYSLDPNSTATIRAALSRTEASRAALARLRPGIAGGAQ
ncbi:PadR family transcriptional regulator [Actinokineospora diospyrosa]|uniref:Transcriptional regulator PadR-like family protein n=1 Tax=Actinokineospora diospyrosa TaxID=103728 RepID=A0ABT1IHC0_9PSEU|nr:PadR family transcriptional regulator [Actinokineospora diospyrosa]MCP2272050.1 Transcriptional regulator PadR-like family protein [Actinokineospora diospyrosa]